MPVEGYKTVTIKKTVLDKLSNYAKAIGKSIPETVDYLVSEAQKKGVN